jgi:hypothetical protein
MRAAVFVLRKHPRLIWFPILTAIFTLGIAAFFMAPIIAITIASFAAHPLSPHARPFDGLKLLPAWTAPYCLLVYPLSMFAATFCNVAFYSQMIAALNGDAVSIRAGLQVSVSRIKSILVWTLFGGLVGGLIRAIEERLGFFGRVMMGLIGLSWSVACIFVIPIIIREEATGNPITILKKSAATIKRTWGETFTGYVGLRMASVIFLFLSLAALGSAIVLAVELNNLALGLVAGLLWFLAFIAWHMFTSLASQAYLCALYIYASEGVIPEPYDQSLLNVAWKVK